MRFVLFGRKLLFQSYSVDEVSYSGLRISFFFLFISFFLILPIRAQELQLTSQDLGNSTSHDVAVALDMLPFSISTMKTEAVVLADDLLLDSANPSNQQIMGRSAFTNSDASSSATKLNSVKLLQKVIQPPHRRDFNLNGSVAFVETTRSHVIQNYGEWEAPNFYNIERQIFDQEGYLIAQKSFYYPEELPDPVIALDGGWLNRVWWPGKNRNKKKLEAEAEAANEVFKEGRGRKIEGCYALDIDFEAEGFDCFDSENRLLYVTEWNPKGQVIKKDSYQLHADGPWVVGHVEESFVEPKYKIERVYDVVGNLSEYKSSGDITTQHLRYFYNENNQRVTEAVLEPTTGQALECKFLIYGYFDTLEAVNYYTVKRVADDTIDQDTSSQDRDIDANQTAAFRSPLTQQNYTCEKEIPSILTLQRSTVMAYGWLYDSNQLLAGRRKQEISHYDASGVLTERIIYNYLQSQPTTLAAINKYDGSGQSTASIVFDYDKQGRLVKEERFQYAGADNGEAGKLLEQSNYIYKAKESTLLEKTIEDYEHSRSKLVEQYDEAGNLIREQRYELFNRLNILSNMFRLKSDVSRSYTGRSFVNEIQKEEGNNKVHESYSYVFDYSQDAGGQILNWVQKNEGSYVNKFDSSYAEPHHTIARVICYYPNSQALSTDLVCTSPF